MRRWRFAVALSGALAGTALAVEPPSPPSPPVPAAAPRAPSTDVWIADLVRSGAAWKLENPRNLTDRDGYDNQPSFLPDSSALLYTSERDGQTDIYEADVASRVERRLTKTPESEYSPEVVPDASGLSVVRVEADGTQRIWRFPWSGGEPSLVLPNLKGVGYYAWLDGETLVAFVLGEPPTLVRVDLPSGAEKVIASDIGRSLHRIPGSEAASYTAAPAGGKAVAVRGYDPATGTVREIAPAPPGAERDFAWTPDGTLVAGAGSKLYRLRPGKGATWLPFADLAATGIHEVSRLTVSPDGTRIAFVAAR